MFLSLFQKTMKPYALQVRGTKNFSLNWRQFPVSVFGIDWNKIKRGGEKLGDCNFITISKVQKMFHLLFSLS